MKDFILSIIKNIKDYKLLVWIFILGVLILIILYPIIDANFLYYKRISNRVEILEKVSKIDISKLKNKQLIEEYNSILNEISEKEDKYLNNIFIYEENTKNSIIKIASATWIFILVTIFVPLSEENRKKGLKFNITCCVACLLIAALCGYIGYIIPTVINVFINVILYNIVIIFLLYTIYKACCK